MDKLYGAISLFRLYFLRLNAATSFCCEAPEMFDGQRNFKFLGKPPLTDNLMICLFFRGKLMLNKKLLFLRGCCSIVVMVRFRHNEVPTEMRKSAFIC